MKKGIVFIITICIIFMVFGLMTLLLPSKVIIANQANIRAPVAKVKDQVVDFRKWHNWYDAFADSSVQKVYLNDDSSIVQLNDGSKTLTLKRTSVVADTVNVELTSSSSTRLLYQFVFINREDVHSNLLLNVIIYLKWYPWQKVKGLFMHKMADSFYESMVERIKYAAEES